MNPFSPTPPPSLFFHTGQPRTLPYFLGPARPAIDFFSITASRSTFSKNLSIPSKEIIDTRVRSSWVIDGRNLSHHSWHIITKKSKSRLSEPPPPYPTDSQNISSPISPYLDSKRRHAKCRIRRYLVQAETASIQPRSLKEKEKIIYKKQHILFLLFPSCSWHPSHSVP